MDCLLRNLLELYIHDMSAAFAVEIGPDGRFGYEKLPLYWSEPDRRHAFLIKAGSGVAGFALVTRDWPASDNPTDFDVAEFFVLRAHRRAGVGRRAAIALWDTLPGQWAVRVVEANPGGCAFWSEVVRAYTGGAYREIVREDGSGRWRVFRFASAALRVRS